VAVTRRLERERRLMAHLRAQDALTPASALRLEQLSADERDTAHDLMAVGVVRSSGSGCYLAADTVSGLRRKRARLAIGGALAFAALAGLTVLLVLHRP
jgi:hypothetical protein